MYFVCYISDQQKSIQVSIIGHEQRLFLLESFTKKIKITSVQHALFYWQKIFVSKQTSFASENKRKGAFLGGKVTQIFWDEKFRQLPEYSDSPVTSG